MIVRVLLVAVAAAVGIAAFAPSAHGQEERPREIIERVAAVVNDEAIFLSEVRRRAQPMLERALSQPTQAERMEALRALYREVTERLVEQELIKQAARDMQVRVTTADVQRAIDNVRNQSGLTEDEFWEAVRAQGYTESQYRSDVRQQLLRLKVLNNRARGRVNVTESDVREEYDRRVRDANRDSCFEVEMVMVPVAEGASATEVSAARRQAEEKQRTLTAQNFASQGAIDLGRICEGEFNPELERALAGMSVGQISDPVRGPNGFYILHLKRRVASSSIPEYQQVRQQLYQAMVEQAMRRQERLLLQELRRDAVIDQRI